MSLVIGYRLFYSMRLLTFLLCVSQPCNAAATVQIKFFFIPNENTKWHGSYHFDWDGKLTGTERVQLTEDELCSRAFNLMKEKLGSQNIANRVHTVMFCRYTEGLPVHNPGRKICSRVLGYVNSNMGTMDIQCLPNKAFRFESKNKFKSIPFTEMNNKITTIEFTYYCKVTTDQNSKPQYECVPVGPEGVPFKGFAYLASGSTDSVNVSTLFFS